MALIVEVVDRAGAVRTRHRLDGRPLTIGRGYDNDLILDDMYVDARHARIHIADDGSIEVEDLGSINGLVAVDGQERVPRLAVQAGTQVRVGRTILRFRDPAEPVQPAVAEVATGGPLFARLLPKPWFRAATAVTAVGMVMIYTWSGLYFRDSGQVAIAAGLGFALLGVVWCGIWALASRVVLNRFNFMGHYTIFSTLAIPGMLFTTLSAWLLFLFPDNALSGPVGVLAWFAASTASIALHLSLASSINAVRRWRTGAIVTGVITVMFGLLLWAGSQVYTDVPTFNGVLKPVSGRLLPTMDVAEFSDVVDELTAEADEMVED